MDTYKLELFVQAFAYVICLTSRSVMAYSNRRLFLTNSDCIVRNYDMAKSIFAYLFIQMIWLFFFFTEEEDGEGEEEDEEDAE